MLAAGSEKAAAHRLGLSHSTVKHHPANARSKVGAATTAQLVWILAPRLPEPDSLGGPIAGRSRAFRALHPIRTGAGPEVVGEGSVGRHNGPRVLNSQDHQRDTMKRTILLSLAAVAIVVAACSSAATSAPKATPTAAPSAAPAGDIVQVATAAGSFKTLLKAATAAGLVDTLKGAGPFTVFAPTDAAFAALPAGTLDALLKDPAKLKDILLYHVVSGKVTADQVVKLTSAPTVQGKAIKIAVKDGTVYLNDTVKVVTTDIPTSNGVIHVIDAVLLPPSM